jgi:hypothetical protein
MESWIELEQALRRALPVCSVAPPNQPAELLAALRINRRIGQEDEERILALRDARNRVAYQPHEPPDEEARRYEEEVDRLVEMLAGDSAPGAC